MTGTGTQTDPYIVSEYADFIEAIQTSDVYVKCADNTVWDFNEIAPTGLKDVINVNCSEINGNNAVLINITIDTARDVFDFNVATTIKNLNFLNFYLVRKTENYPALFWCGSSNVDFVNCKISGMLQDNTYLFGKSTSSRNVKFRESSINLRLNNGGLGYYNGSDPVESEYAGEYINTIVELSGQHGSTRTNPAMYLDNSTVTGNCAFLNNTLPIAGINSAVDIKLPDTQYVSRAYAGWSNYLSVSKIVVNTDKAVIYDSDAGYYIKANTEQIKNAEYLLSKGFPIGVE
jgi:hypothetical protein